jgi:hypothetical protein
MYVTRPFFDDSRAEFGFRYSYFLDEVLVLRRERFSLVDASSSEVDGSGLCVSLLRVRRCNVISVSAVLLLEIHLVLDAPGLDYWLRFKRLVVRLEVAQ